MLKSELRLVSALALMVCGANEIPTPTMPMERCLENEQHCYEDMIEKRLKPIVSF